MSNSNLLFANYLRRVREKPKWMLNLLLLIIISILITWVTNSFVDYYEELVNTGLTPTDAENLAGVSIVFSYVMYVFLALLMIIVNFVSLLLISRIMKSNISAYSIYSASVFITLISYIVTFIVMVIQWAFNLDPTVVNITSMNILDEGNRLLGTIDLQHIISGYLFGVVLYSTSQLHTKHVWIWSIIYIIITIIASYLLLSVL